MLNGHMVMISKARHCHSCRTEGLASLFSHHGRFVVHATWENRYVEFSLDRRLVEDEVNSEHRGRNDRRSCISSPQLARTEEKGAEETITKAENRGWAATTIRQRYE
jgi:hypothetical protein